MKHIVDQFKNLSGNKKIWLLSALTAVIVLTTAGTFAAYISRSYVKGVATTPKQSMELSSDILSIVSQTANEKAYPNRKLVLPEKQNNDSEPYYISFMITNTSESAVSTKRMQYYLHISGLPKNARVFRDEEEVNIVLGGTDSNGYKAPVMNAYTKETHKYTISIPKESVGDLDALTIKAIPDEDSDSSGNMLAVKLQLSVAGVVAGFSYSSSFLDKSGNSFPWEYAAFNYEISVANASEAHTMRLIWDSRYVEIDPLFLEELPDTSRNIKNSEDNEYERVLEFKMDSIEVENDQIRDNYLIKFYRIKGQVDLTETVEPVVVEANKWQSSWTEIENIIRFQEVIETTE